MFTPCASFTERRIIKLRNITAHTGGRAWMQLPAADGTENCAAFLAADAPVGKECCKNGAQCCVDKCE